MERRNFSGIDHVDEAIPHVILDGLNIDAISSNIRNARNISWEKMKLMPEGEIDEGDLIVVCVCEEPGSVTSLESLHGIDEDIYKDEVLIGVVANRLSGTSESGHVPKGKMLSEVKCLQLLSVGGVVGEVDDIPKTKTQRPTNLRPIGLLELDGKKVSLHDQYEWSQSLTFMRKSLLVCGTSAEVGKTTTAKRLIGQLVISHANVGAAKISGTGRMRDISQLREAGAVIAADFPEVGLASTYTSQERYLRATYSLLNKMEDPDIDGFVLEAGGDLLEANVDVFLTDKDLMDIVAGIVLVPNDVLGALGALQILKEKDVKAPVHVAIPWRQNAASTRKRIGKYLPQCEVFDSASPSELQTIAESILYA